MAEDMIYKIITIVIGMGEQTLEARINQYAREGYIVHTVDFEYAKALMERPVVYAPVKPPPADPKVD